jgi:plastocyanin
MRKALAVSVVILTAVLGLAACSSDSKSSSSSTTSSTTGASKKTTAPVQLSGQVTNKGTKDISGKGASTDLELEADDFYFNPTFIKAAPGQKVTLEIKNEGSATHTFTSPTLNVDQEIAPDQSVKLDVTMPASGTAAWYCRFHRSSGMQGAFFMS